MVGPGKHGPSPCGWCLCGFMKWPISHDTATLVVCAAQPAEVGALPSDCTGCDVAYIGWYVYGAALQVWLTGSQIMCRQPRPAPVTIEPRPPLVMSRTPVNRPDWVSLMVSWTVSPGFIRNTSSVGVTLWALRLSGPVGPIGMPLLVRKANCVVSSQFGLTFA